MTETSTKSLVPPHSKTSEMMVLGSMLTSINSLNMGADSLDDSDFYFTEHKIMFQVLKNAYKQDKPVDVHLASEELKRQDKLETVGGVGFVMGLAQYAGTSAHIEQYIELVQSKSILRRMIYAAQEVEKTALSEPQDVHASLDEAQQKFFVISQTANPGAGFLISDLLTGSKAQSQQPYLKELQDRQELFQKRGPQEGMITGLPTHFVDLDKIINGLGNSNLIIVAARPAMGKTAFACNIAENVCFRSGMPVGIFSLEMSAEQLLHRLICSQSEVESDKIKTGSLSGFEYQRIVAAVNHMQKFTMVIDDQPGLKITDLRARARRMKEAFGINLLVVDYLQLLSGSGFSRTAENRQNEISEISRMLKTLAREIDIPIICLSQLSRKVEERAGHRPMMSDLRESGCLSGDALITDARTKKTYTIKELADRPVQTSFFVHAIDEHLQLGEHKMVKVFYSGRKVVYALKTRSGRSIEASANHPFRKTDGWHRLDQLKIGDKVAIPKSRRIEESLWATILRKAKERMQRPERELSVKLATCSSAILTTGITQERLNPRHLPKEEQLRPTESGVEWDEIVSITEIGEKDVYDATVEGVHNFVANGIIVHNSIEQDADIVVFLMRREYYDPYDKPGQAEVIIAKNRHGGVGSVNLSFRKEFAQFANYTSLPTPGAKAEEDPFAALR